MNILKKVKKLIKQIFFLFFQNLAESRIPVRTSRPSVLPKLVKNRCSAPNSVQSTRYVKNQFPKNNANKQIKPNRLSLNVDTIEGRKNKIHNSKMLAYIALGVGGSMFFAFCKILDAEHLKSIYNISAIWDVTSPESMEVDQLMKLSNETLGLLW